MSSQTTSKVQSGDMCKYLQVNVFLGSTALVNNTPDLNRVRFSWHLMPSEEYMTQAEGDLKRFDFIHMIQVCLGCKTNDDKTEEYTLSKQV